MDFRRLQGTAPPRRLPPWLFRVALVFAAAAALAAGLVLLTFLLVGLGILWLVRALTGRRRPPPVAQSGERIVQAKFRVLEN